LPDRALPATLDKGPHQRVDLDVFFGAPGRVGVEVQVLPQAATRYAQVPMSIAWHECHGRTTWRAAGGVGCHVAVGATMRNMVLAIILLFERCASARSSYVLSLSTNVRP